MVLDLDETLVHSHTDGYEVAFFGSICVLYLVCMMLMCH